MSCRSLKAWRGPCIVDHSEQKENILLSPPELEEAPANVLSVCNSHRVVKEKAHFQLDDDSSLENSGWMTSPRRLV